MFKLFKQKNIWTNKNYKTKRKNFNKLLEIMEKDKINAILETLDKKNVKI